MLLRNNFEGGTNGQSISSANSGGSSGDAFNFAQNVTYSSAQAAHGARSAQCAAYSTAVLQWFPFTALDGSLYSRANFRIHKRTTDDEYVNLHMGTETVSDQYYQWSAFVLLPSSGSATLELYHYVASTDTTTLVATANITVPLDTWCRLELRADNNATSTAELRFYNSVDSTTATTTVTGSVSHSGVFPWEYAGAAMDTWEPSAANIWVDDVAVTDAGWLGPGGNVNITVTPGALTGAAVFPAPALSVGSVLTPGALTGAAVFPAPQIFTGAVTTPVDAPAVTGTAVFPAPTIAAAWNVHLAPAPIVGAAEFPAAAISVPINPGDQINAPGQIEWNGFLLGGSTVYRWLTLEGWWDLPDIDPGNVAHPSRHGAYSGRDLAQERHVIYTALIRARREDMQAVVDELRVATKILDDDTELPLAIRVLDDILIGYGKITRRSIPIDKLVRLGHAQLTIQWTLSDPILQSRDLASAVLEDGAWQTLTNLGDAPASPTIRIRGPVTGPTLFVRHEEAGRVDERALELDLHLDSGETLIIDTYYGTAVVGEESVVDTLTGSSVPIPDLVLPAGQSLVGYGTSGGGSPAVMLWRHSYL